MTERADNRVDDESRTPLERWWPVIIVVLITALMCVAYANVFDRIDSFATRPIASLLVALIPNIIAASILLVTAILLLRRDIRGRETVVPSESKDTATIEALKADVEFLRSLVERLSERQSPPEIKSQARLGSVLRFNESPSSEDSIISPESSESIVVEDPTRAPDRELNTLRPSSSDYYIPYGMSERKLDS